jgi:hypothetical protein
VKPVLVVEWVISHYHMRVMLRALNGPKHRHMGFYAEYEDFGNIWSQSKKRPDLYDPPQNAPSKIFGDYGGDVQGGWLRIYRDIQPRQPSPLADISVTKAMIDEAAVAFTADEIRVLKRLAAVVSRTGLL